MGSSCWGYSQCAVPGKMLHGVGSWVQCIEFGWFHLKAWFHPLSQLPFPDLTLPDLALPELPFPDGGVHIIEAGHVVGQERIGGVKGNKEWVVAVCG